jgi:hypothetical protein
VERTSGSIQWDLAAGGEDLPSRTTHLRSASQEVCDGHEGVFAAKAKSGDPFFLRLSK